MTSSSDHDGLKSSDGVKVIETTLERPLQIRLWEDRTRGELWVPTYDSAGLALLADDYQRIAGNNAVDNGQRTFEFKVMKPGTHRVLFEKRMGWKFTAEDRRVFEVTAPDSSSRRSA
ncbi:MAG: protease inhibitor I42 family protein [Nitrospirota bacterium]|nr:protease inhibitor I42 family protein [Nitrospirota bacterium]MDP2381813.1 protease inhibitor I42 family protein [Nitrospirota bacterium]MDP3597787.1 protease inhibitor I42 family protein [Nitrospirota bacterium]